MKKKHPIGIQDFQELIEGGYTYVDKTALIYQLISGKGHFLSRPRRFGKTLLLTTLEALFRGKKELFKGLWIEHSDHDWRQHPVISLDFSRVFSSTPQKLSSTLNGLLKEIADQYHIGLQIKEDPGLTFANLILLLAKEEKVVILIDEYDRPIIDHLKDPALCDANRAILHDFFIVIKSLGKHVRYAFVTGVSKITKVSMFSGMNNLPDISFYPAYASLTGITEAELDRYYDDAIKTLAEKLNVAISTLRIKMREWYNGYSFAYSNSVEKVYNPVSIHLLFDRQQFANFWFGTATPTFAIQMIREREYAVQDFEEGTTVGFELEESHDIGSVELVKLLYQTGYLTISSVDESRRLYYLKYPNEEVRRSFQEHLLHAFTSLESGEVNLHFQCMQKALMEKNFEQFFHHFNCLLQEIPYPLHINHESYYHSLLYLLLKTLGYQVNAEVMTNRGRLDMVIECKEHLLLFEFKINQTADTALKQIRNKAYFEKYLSKKSLITLIGVNFDSKKRQISDWVQTTP